MANEIDHLNANVHSAARLRAALKHSLSVNILGSRSAGTTSILQKTLPRLPCHIRAAVLSANVRTEADAVRLEHYGFPVRWPRRNAGELDASQVETAVQDWLNEGIQLLLIENAGNLAALSRDLGEDAKVIVLAATDALSLAQQYADVLRCADLILLNKCDLISNASTAIDTAIASARRIGPVPEIIKMSCVTDVGLESWLNWILKRLKKKEAFSSAYANRA